MAGMDRRRKSVFAESYEPGDEDEAVEKVRGEGGDEWLLNHSYPSVLVYRLCTPRLMIRGRDLLKLSLRVSFSVPWSPSSMMKCWMPFLRGM